VDTFDTDKTASPLTTKIFTMKKVFLTITALIFSLPAFMQTTDTEGCKDSPMFPTRMSNYYILECKDNYDAMDFNVAAGNAKGLGGTTMFLNTSEAIAVFKIMKNGHESAWVKVECGGDDNNDMIVLSIIQLAEMVQEVTADDILKALNKDGHIALYINFETGKSEIKAESQAVIDQLVQMLKANPDLKISIEGHTDNVGAAAANQTLSEKRATAVLDALAAKGIDRSRLSFKGYGASKPLMDNNTEDGKAKNRRVEIVKK
jgi:OOP family OmpA-OmpF porin